MLEIEDVSKNFGNVQALDEIEFKIEKNSVVGLLGPNGAGKTTLMRILVGFLSASRGKILWNKRPVNTKSLTYKKRVGYLPENNPLYGNMIVLEFLQFICEMKGGFKKEILSVIKTCGLKDVIGQKIETLSKGYRQRVGIAAALLGDPYILVLDEPTSGLDPKQIIEIRLLIKKLAKKKMVLLSTHILPEAREICDRLLIINQGRIVLDESTMKIKNIEKKFIELTS